VWGDFKSDGDADINTNADTSTYINTDPDTNITNINAHSDTFTNPITNQHAYTD